MIYEEKELGHPTPPPRPGYLVPVQVQLLSPKSNPELESFINIDWNSELEFGIGLRNWTSKLDFGIGLRNWNSELEFGIGILNWNLELEFGIGIRNWNSELEFGIGIRNWNSELEFITAKQDKRQNAKIN